MMRGILCRVLMGLALALPSTQLIAQLNLVSGYDISLGGTEQINEVIDVFNEGNSTGSLEGLRLHHAFRLGLQYRFEWGALEGTYIRSFTRKRADNVAAFSGDVTDLIFSHGISTWMAGIEFGKTFLVGITMNYHRLRYEADFGDLESTIHRDNSLGNRFYLGWQSRGSGNVSIALKPYVQVLWSDINIFPIEEALTGRTGTCSTCVEKRPLYFGISITIQNGPQ